MTDLLEKAFQAATKLPAAEQDRLAAWIIAEIDAEQRWDRSFATSQQVLSSLADEALLEHRRGKTKPLVVDQA